VVSSHIDNLERVNAISMATQTLAEKRYHSFRTEISKSSPIS